MVWNLLFSFRKIIYRIIVVYASIIKGPAAEIFKLQIRTLQRLGIIYYQSQLIADLHTQGHALAAHHIRRIVERLGKGGVIQRPVTAHDRPLIA